MKDEIKGHFISSPERVSLQDYELEMIAFSVDANRSVSNALKVLQKSRIAVITLRELMIIMIGALMLTAIILWSIDSTDND
jgi:hypothetical protein